MGALDELLQRQAIWRASRALAPAAASVPSGFEALDAELPGGGWPQAGLTEILSDASGIGELQLLFPALARLSGAGKRAVWVAPPHVPYAPALAVAGIDLVHLLIVQPATRRDALWAAEQALRSGSCHALAAWLPKVRYAELQRLAVAAETSRAAAFILRPLAAEADSSPACLRLALAPAGAELAVRIIKRRGAPLARPLHLPRSLAFSPATPFHALGRAALSRGSGGEPRAARRLGLPVHA